MFQIPIGQKVTTSKGGFCETNLLHKRNANNATVLIDVIKECWHQDRTLRPTAQQCVQLLANVVDEQQLASDLSMCVCVCVLFCCALN
jgi:hypothetical protein